MSGQASANGTTGRKGKEISVLDEGRIVGWHDEGVSKKVIGRRLDRNETTIRAFLKAVGLYLFLLIKPGLISML